MAESWQPRAEFEGDLGRIYGVQWRDWRSVAHEIPAFGTPVGSIKRTDQLQELVDGIKRDPTGRRHIVTAWNPGELELMCLPPCPLLFQVYVNVDSLDMCVYQRSCDLFLGLPFDIAGYALLQRLIARKVGLSSGRLTFFIGDAHVYLNHMSQVNTVLERRPHSAPWLQLEADADLWDFQPHHAKLVCYEHHGAVPAPLNV
jgi:thymidylate synthase